MIDHTSRYAAIARGTHALPDGAVATYVRRRFLPDPAALPLLAELAITDGERLDLFAARTLGDPLQFWRIADANAAMSPFDLVSRAGRVLRIPVPQP
jgi:hypothetical protein